ncbi:hypothetical protein SY91_05896 [Burkholderia cenocepacia]|nr:hypothetical protein SY91_05896 [Burkholderia cenocepacia]
MKRYSSSAAVSKSSSGKSGCVSSAARVARMRRGSASRHASSCVAAWPASADVRTGSPAGVSSSGAISRKYGSIASIAACAPAACSRFINWCSAWKRLDALMNSLFSRARRPLRIRVSGSSNTAMLRAASNPTTSATKRV